MSSQDKPTRVAVAMSGGVDSAAAASLLVDQGCDVVGLTARMWQEGSRCCSLADVMQARKVCWFLDIPHHVINAREQFACCVAERFAAEYIRGRTPSPCVSCNQVVKFGLLLTRAVQLGCSHLASGHYARREKAADGLWRLLEARDSTRDQSYFLHRLSQRQLACALFPLGELRKKEDVLAYVHKRNLPLAPREESRDICFAPKGRHHKVVEQIFPAAARSGPIVDASGRKIGQHRGVHRYTVGQRRGLGIAASEPLYVTRIDARSNVIEVGGRSKALSHLCIVEDARWISGHPPAAGKTLQVRIRCRQTPAAAKLQARSDGRFELTFQRPQFAIAPGQAAVLYDGREILGGGWISPPGNGRGTQRKGDQFTCT